MKRLRVAPQAEADLRSIRRFIAKDNPHAGVAWVQLIRNKAALLAEHPGMGRCCAELAPQLRSFPVGDYLIFYRSAEDGIEVVRVLHAARDLPSLFSQSTG